MNFTRIGLLLVFVLLGVTVYQLLWYLPISLPYSLNLLNWNHFGIIPLITVPLSIITALVLFRKNHYSKRIILAFTGLVALYSFIFFSSHFEERVTLGSMDMRCWLLRCLAGFYPPFHSSGRMNQRKRKLKIMLSLQPV